jgi:MFS family permease
MALRFGPQFLLLPWTGFAADHFNQRKLLITTQATMGALDLALGGLTVAGVVQLWHVYSFAFLFGSAAAFDAPVRQTFVAELVGDEDLHNAVALNSTSFNAARMIGPAVSGVIIGAIGTGWAFVINGASFVAVLISLAFLHIAELRPNARAHRAKVSFTEGFRYVWCRPDLKTILVMLFLIGTFGLNFPIFISTMAVGVFHTDARGYGLLSSIMAIGTVAGALLSAGREKPWFPLLPIGAAVFGLGCILAAIAPGYWFFAAALVVIGVAALTFTNTTNSLMQLSTEPAMRGRVMALRVGIALGGYADRRPDRRLGGQSLRATLGARRRRSVGFCCRDCGSFRLGLPGAATIALISMPATPLSLCMGLFSPFSYSAAGSMMLPPCRRRQVQTASPMIRETPTTIGIQ